MNRMSDSISRQAAIDAIDIFVKVDEENCTEYDIGYNDGIDFAISSLSVLPSAQPEQKTGRWIEKEIYETRQKEEMQVAKCSNCKKYLTTPYFYSFTHYDFCPNCGARMEGDTLK